MVKRLKALADKTRLYILYLIAQTDECCVCEIQELLDLTAPTASRNLRILEEAGFVTKRRAGKWMYYRLDKMQGNWEKLRTDLLQAASDSDDNPDLTDKIKAFAEAGCCSTSRLTGDKRES